MNPFKNIYNSVPHSSSGNIPNWLIYFIILVAIIISVVFYLFPFQNDFITNEKVAKVYFADNITKAHTELIKIFNEKYKGEIEVIPVDIPTEKFTTNKRKELIALTLRSRNSRIDLFAVDQIWIPRFAKWAEPLENYFSANELEKLLPQALNTCVYNDTMFAIPFFIDVGVLYYRKDLIEKLDNASEVKEKLKEGISWNDLIKLKESFRNKYLYVFQGDAYEGLICNYIEILGIEGGGIYANGKFDVYNSQTIASAQKLVDLIYKYKITPKDVAKFDESKSYEYALENNIPFFRGWPTTLKYSNLVSKTTNKLNLLGEAALPKGSNGYSTSTIGGWNFILSRFSSVKKEAVTFIKFVVSQEIQELNFNTGSYLPIIKSFYNNNELIKKYPRLGEFKQIIENGLHRPSDDNYTKISDVLSLYLNKALKKELTVQEALKSAQAQINSILNAALQNEN
ncbi:MAG: extracellular solute-binding protein [Bacteroidetes bacterium]|nr:extracellular solute-binding protein [Bacteroidota bacterium]MBU1681131.1 extracellular solute-binding protein [Bacteroidota bacterium]MBU2506583.1 extracellular solute-binding protein [Bacteroidota bacterium]